MAKKMWIAAGALAAWWWWPSSGSAVHVRPQAAVLDDGFAVIEDGKRIVEYDERGDKLHETAISMPADAHVVGMASGVGAAYRDGKQVVIGRVGTDGKLEKPERFGRSVAKMCDQTATNQHRFAVMWKEKDGQMWIVHGPTHRLAAEPVGLASDDARDDDYCAVASADQQIAMLWREGDRTYMTTCNNKRCGTTQTVKLDRKRDILGYGCTKDSCAIVTHEGNSVEVTWVWLRNGKIEWRRPLPSAGSRRVTAVGVGSRVAIAYDVEPEPVVRVVGVDGSMNAVWQGRSDGIPGLAWSGSALLVAAHRDGDIATSIVRP